MTDLDPQTTLPKRHLDLWIGMLLGVGVAAGISAVQKLSILGLSFASFGEIEGRIYFVVTAAILVVTHIFRQSLLSWKLSFVRVALVVSGGLLIVSIWGNQHNFWPSGAMSHFVILFPFAFFLFSLLVYSEVIFTLELRLKKLIPLLSIALQMGAIFVLLYVGRLIFPPNHVFLTIYLALALFDMTSRSPALNKEERWESLLS